MTSDAPIYGRVTGGDGEPIVWPDPRCRQQVPRGYKIKELSGLFEWKVRGEGHQPFCGNGRVLGPAIVITEGDERAGFDLYFLPGLLDNASTVIAGDLLRKTRLLWFWIEVLDEQKIPRADRGRDHFDQDLIVLDLRDRNLREAQHVQRGANVVEDNRFHRHFLKLEF
jgi:hypothetical protein